MDSLQTFIQENYIAKPDSKIPVKDIYENFRAWIIGKFGISSWNNITQKQVYTALKQLPDYLYIRYSSGFCLKGISYKSVNTDNTKTINDYPITLNVITHDELVLVNNITHDELVLVNNTDQIKVKHTLPQIVLPRAFQTTTF